MDRKVEINFVTPDLSYKDSIPIKTNCTLKEYQFEASLHNGEILGLQWSLRILNVDKIVWNHVIFGI